jgi:flagellar biosynthesis anti-sigma factor FlgM
MKINHASPGATRAADPTVIRTRAPRTSPSSDGAATDRPAATVSLSTRSRELHAVAATDGAQVPRSERVQDARDRLANGTYEVKPELIARRLLDLRG